MVDDCLSALDAHVGKKIFKNVFKKFLKGKTIIMATHALQYLNEVDRILLMENGEVVLEGSYEELKNERKFKNFILSQSKKKN